MNSKQTRSEIVTTKGKAYDIPQPSTHKSAEQMHNGKQIFSTNFEVYGKVQGVLFRKHTQTEATKLGVTGWCMNTLNGTVKGVMEAPLDQLTEMKFWLQHRGSPQSIIDRAIFSPNEEVSGYSFKSFAILT